MTSHNHTHHTAYGQAAMEATTTEDCRRHFETAAQLKTELADLEKLTWMELNSNTRKPMTLEAKTGISSGNILLQQSHTSVSGADDTLPSGEVAPPPKQMRSPFSSKGSALAALKHDSITEASEESEGDNDDDPNTVEFSQPASKRSLQYSLPDGYSDECTQNMLLLDPRTGRSVPVRVQTTAAPTTMDPAQVRDCRPFWQRQSSLCLAARAHASHRSVKPSHLFACSFAGSGPTGHGAAEGWRSTKACEYHVPQNAGSPRRAADCGRSNKSFGCAAAERC